MLLLRESGGLRKVHSSLQQHASQRLSKGYMLTRCLYIGVPSSVEGVVQLSRLTANHRSSGSGLGASLCEVDLLTHVAHPLLCSLEYAKDKQQNAADVTLASRESSGS